MVKKSQNVLICETALQSFTKALREWFPLNSLLNSSKILIVAKCIFDT